MAELFSTNFPIYSIASLTDRLFYIAGGGGKAKTGIPNALELLKLEYNEQSSFYTVESLHKHDLGDQLIMQSDVYHNGKQPSMIGASVGKECHIYELRGITDVAKNGGSEDDVEKDSLAISDKEEVSKMSDDKEEKPANSESSDESVEYSIDKSACVTTDEALKDSCQNVVRFIRDGSRVITGGEDGIIRVWSLPLLKLKETLEGHRSEVTNIITHPDKEIAVSISRDCSCKVWDLESYSESKSFTWTRHDDYRFRSCCFSDDGSDMFSINIPLKPSTKKRKKSFIVKWSTNDWHEVKYRSMGLSILTVITTRGRYLAVGDVSGDIFILSTNLELVSKTNAVHTSFITGLCFMPNEDSSSTVPPLLLSTSVDKRCCLSFIAQKESGVSVYLILIILSVVLAVAVAIVMQINVI